MSLIGCWDIRDGPFLELGLKSIDSTLILDAPGPRRRGPNPSIPVRAWVDPRFSRAIGFRPPK